MPGRITLLLPRGHGRKPLAHLHALGKSWPAISSPRLVVEHVHVRRAAGHQHVDDALGPGGEIRESGQAVQSRQYRRGRRRGPVPSRSRLRRVASAAVPMPVAVRPKNCRRLMRSWIVRSSFILGRQVIATRLQSVHSVVIASSRFITLLTSAVHARQFGGFKLPGSRGDSPCEISFARGVRIRVHIAPQPAERIRAASFAPARSRAGP